MNILLINHYVGPTEFCPPYRPNYLAREWVRKGHCVTLVGASRSHLFFKSPSFQGTRLEIMQDGVRHLLLKTPGYCGNGLGRVINMFAFWGQLIRQSATLQRESQPDLVIAGSTHLLDSFPAVRLARRTGARMVREIRDLWPRTLIELGGMSRWNPLILLIQRAESFAYRRSDRVVTTLPGSLPHMREHGLSADRWRFVPQGVDPSEWSRAEACLPKPHSLLLSELRAKGTFVLGYTGSLGLAYSLPTLVEAVHRLRGRNVAVLFVGQGPVRNTLEQQAAELGVKNVHFLPPVPKSSIPSLLRQLDATYMSWARRPIFQFGVSPNKLMDYLIAARPVLYSSDAPNDLVQESGCGLSVPAENSEAVAAGIVNIMALSPEERARLGQKGREYVLEHHRYERLAQLYLEAVA